MSNMGNFCLDLETCGTSTETIILSAAIVHFDLAEQVTFEELVERSLLVKFDMKEQRKMGRTMRRSTLEWWATQPKEAQRVSFIPSSNDVSVDTGLTLIDEYVAEYGGKNSLCWSRGAFDQLILGSLYEQLERKPPLNYNKFMDIRTALRLMKESTNAYGYVTIPNFDERCVIKHNPVHDIALDVMGILYGD